mmetsp:Transcript_116747/g.376794  ORF Transcript_116747/g.376794 Transcript_116747/m.376794 type:complete len:441 (+) Transcript_116747:919-2241(+)
MEAAVKAAVPLDTGEPSERFHLGRGGVCPRLTGGLRAGLRGRGRSACRRLEGLREPSVRGSVLPASPAAVAMVSALACNCSGRGGLMPRTAAHLEALLPAAGLRAQSGTDAGASGAAAAPPPRPELPAERAAGSRPADEEVPPWVPRSRPRGLPRRLANGGLPEAERTGAADGPPSAVARELPASGRERCTGGGGPAMGVDATKPGLAEESGPAECEFRSTGWIRRGRTVPLRACASCEGLSRRCTGARSACLPVAALRLAEEQGERAGGMSARTPPCNVVASTSCSRWLSATKPSKSCTRLRSKFLLDAMSSAFRRITSSSCEFFVSNWPLQSSSSACAFSYSVRHLIASSFSSALSSPTSGTDARWPRWPWSGPRSEERREVVTVGIVRATRRELNCKEWSVSLTLSRVGGNATITTVRHCCWPPRASCRSCVSLEFL